MLHPQRAGIATHASFFIEKPTIGTAKNDFIGTCEPPDNVQAHFLIFMIMMKLSEQPYEHKPM